MALVWRGCDRGGARSSRIRYTASMHRIARLLPLFLWLLPAHAGAGPAPLWSRETRG